MDEAQRGGAGDEPRIGASEPAPGLTPDGAVTALEAELEASLVLARAQLAHIRGSLATVATYLAREARPS